MTTDEPDDPVSLLRDANQHLLIAALEAKDMQVKAEMGRLRQQEFLAMLAHELRNPLAPLTMAVGLLGKLAGADPHLPALYKILHRQLAHMTHLVDDLLDASRVSTGKIRLQRRPLLLSEVIDSAVETSRPFIDKRVQTLEIELPADPIVIDGDLVRLAQVFSNLLINAAKFTPEHGHIALNAHKASGAITVSVKDDGAGLAQNLLPLVFDLFAQGPTALDRSQGGLGIGLTLVRSLVEMHGGSVCVKSAGTNLGSEFSVTLPISTQPTPRAGGNKEAVTAVRRILLIDDNVDAVETLRSFLTLEGHAVTCRFDGMSGLSAAEENVFDVIICDIGLPDLDGYELARQLRLRPFKPVPRLIAISGYPPRDVPADTSEADGFDSFLVKPANVATLVRLVSLSAVM